MSEQRVDAKAGWCGNCRAETHGLCASVTCTCPSKGRRNHPLRKVTRGEPRPAPLPMPPKLAPVSKEVVPFAKPEPSPAPKPTTRREWFVSYDITEQAIVLHHGGDDPINIGAAEAQAVRDELTVALIAEQEHRVIRGES